MMNRLPLRKSAADSQVMLTVRVEADLERRLAQLARATGRTKSHYAREAIMRLLREEETTRQMPIDQVRPRFAPVTAR